MLATRVNSALALAVRKAPLAPAIASRVASRFPRNARFLSGEAKAGGIPSKLTLNLMAPHEAVFVAKEVDQVIVPGADGIFGVLPGHVPTISELKPGLVEVTVAPGEIVKFFVSSGFVFAHADSTCDVCALECVKLDDLDASAVASGKSQAEGELNSAQDEVEKAKAQIAVEVYTAMTEALNTK
mmetsp:Transcript_15875/g.31884  ORF Transcript_15875/g.31884 Transcript_15875/m.31884 type:complete len:184 (+) Transcript_15875:28-579(+)